MSELIIEDLAHSDQEEAVALIRAGLTDRWGELDPQLNPDLDDLLGAYGGGRTIVVRQTAPDVTGTRIIGTGTLMPVNASTAEILRMSVASTARRAGVGRLIVDELLATARAWNADRVVLETTSTWTDAVAFYQRCGFDITHSGVDEFGPQTFFEYRLNPKTS